MAQRPVFVPAVESSQTAASGTLRLRSGHAPTRRYSVF